MSKESKRRGPGSSDNPPDLKKERDQFLQSFSKGAKLTEEFVKEHEQLQKKLLELEAENTRLRATLEADAAIRDLLQKIEDLEQEKRDLLSRYREAQAVSTKVSRRF